MLLQFLSLYFAYTSAAHWEPIGIREVSAYNSVPEQTDDTPCIGAQGTDICELRMYGFKTCAANFVPLGSRLRIEGVGICEVRDRMNARFTDRVDIYLGDNIEKAKTFGIQRKIIELWVPAQ